MKTPISSKTSLNLKLPKEPPELKKARADCGVRSERKHNISAISIVTFPFR